VAAKLGYDYALVAPPYFFKPMMKSDLLVEHFRRVADASRIPVLLYSVPQFTGVAIEADVAARLSEIPYCRDEGQAPETSIALAQSCRSCPPVFN